MADRVDFDDYTKDYNKLLGAGTQFFSKSDEYFARYKVDVVRHHMGHRDVRRVLEYGCGIGRNIPFLRAAFPDAVIVGSDISRGSLDIARRENVGVEFVCEEDGAAEDPGSFDLIFVAGVFHHVPVPQRMGVANTLRQRLAGNGALFVFEHNPLNPVTRRIVRDCPYDADAQLLRLSGLREILCQAGLRIEHKAYCLFVPPRLAALSGLESRLGWLPLGGQYWLQAVHPS
jgi:SAM-dependent methyltransferase